MTIKRSEVKEKLNECIKALENENVFVVDDNENIENEEKLMSAKESFLASIKK